MPRETVTPLTGPYEVQVGWGRDRADVQVAVTVEGERSMFWTLLNPETVGLAIRLVLGDEFGAERDGIHIGAVDVNNRDLGTAVLNSLDASTGYYSGLWSTLGRDNVNRLIRLLRKARDSSFGKDE